MKSFIICVLMAVLGFLIVYPIIRKIHQYIVRKVNKRHAYGRELCETYDEAREAKEFYASQLKIMEQKHITGTEYELTLELYQQWCNKLDAAEAQANEFFD